VIAKKVGFGGFGGGGGRTNRITVCKRFENNLHNLVTILTNSNRHYVRCIKPNPQNSPNLWAPPKVLSQLRCNGVMETIALRYGGREKEGRRTGGKE
jgi:myosin heavy subunit